MKTTYLLLIALISFTICDNSGMKFAITSDFFKIISKFDLNKFLKGKTVIDRAEASGTYVLKYDVVCTNLFITDIVAPDKIEVEQETTEEGLPRVKVTFHDIKAAIQIESLYIKYGLISETFENPAGSVSVSYIEGKYYFTNEGKLVISEINVEIEDFTIDVKKDFLNWLIGLFKGLIKDKVTKTLDQLGGTISDAVNNWIDGEFDYDLGYGIAFNFTNTLKPHLVQVMKNEKLNEIGLLFAKYLFSKETLENTLTSVLTFGIHGSCYPNAHPELMPVIPPPPEMNFTKDYFTNEVQLLISAYSLNTLLFMGQSTGFLHKEFTNASHPLFPWNFDTVGLQEILPQFGEKYPGKQLPVTMKAYISVFNHVRPYVEMSEKNGKIFVNFNLDFLTQVSEDPFDDPVLDLSVNVTAELDFTLQVKYDLLTINWGEMKVLDLVEIKNELNVPHDDLVTMVGTNFDTYVINKFVKKYTKNVALASLLTLVTGMKFKNFKLETKEGFLLVSIAVDLN